MNSEQVDQHLASLRDRLASLEQRLSAIPEASLATGLTFTVPKGTEIIETSPQGSERRIYQLVAKQARQPLDV